MREMKEKWQLNLSFVNNKLNLLNIQLQQHEVL